jgi:hypothetical protein
LAIGLSLAPKSQSPSFSLMGICPAPNMIHFVMYVHWFPLAGASRTRLQNFERFLMETFKREIVSIFVTLSGSPWAVHPAVQEVLAEYGHLADTTKTPHGTRRISLQIFHASRAIDSLLGQIATNESAKTAPLVPGTYWTLGKSLKFIRQNGIGGMNFAPATDADLNQLTKDRNKYLHQANVFPTEAEMRRFLVRTIKALQESSTFPP